MTDDHPRIDNPHVAENAERVTNNLYRAIERDDVDIKPEDIERLPEAFETFSDEEGRRLGGLSLELEREAFEGREDMDFIDITETEREYFDLLEKGLERVKNQEG